MVERKTPSPLRLRTVFISDIHLGFRGCSAELLLDHYNGDWDGDLDRVYETARF